MSKQRYNLTIEPEAHAERQRLPGHVRQRMKQTISDLASQLRPHNSKAIDVTDLGVPNNVELRRIRIDKWRLLYAVSDDEQWVWVWGIRERPLYNYQDIEKFTSRLT